MHEILKDRLVTVAYLFLLTLVILAACALSGCLDEHLRTADNFDVLLDTVNTLATVNVASAPLNPYAIPIGIGLSGIIGIIEALRRKEKSGRKHAEQTLNNSNNKS